MVRIEPLAEAALTRDSLRLRSLVQDFIRTGPELGEIPYPNTTDPRILMASAALLELLGERSHQAPPSWTRGIGALPEPFFLLAAAEKMKNLRALCERESPEALRRHGFFAPANFLDFA